MEKVPTKNRMVNSTMVTSNTTNFVVKESIVGQMVEATKDNGTMDRCLDKEK